MPGSGTKLQRISALLDEGSLPVACDCDALVSTKSGLEREAFRAAEPVLWYDAGFDREQEIAGVNKDEGLRRLQKEADH